MLRYKDKTCRDWVTGGLHLLVKGTLLTLLIAKEPLEMVLCGIMGSRPFSLKKAEAGLASLGLVFELALLLRRIHWGPIMN